MGAFPDAASWPYLSTLLRLALALGLGLFVGLERERRGKEAGVRTFALVSVLGCSGGLLGDGYAYLSIGLMLPFVIFLNVHSMQKESDTEMTTSAALFVVGFAGVMCGKGHTFTPVAMAFATAGLLAWKGRLSGFSLGITEAELRSAILLGVLAFIIFPVLPDHAVDPWGLVDPRVVWTSVILIAAIGFVNYILHKVYGSRGVEAASFLAGLVNSTIAVTELASRTQIDPTRAPSAYRGTMLATAAMLLRNSALLAILAPNCFIVAATPLTLMVLASGGLAFAPWSRFDESAAAPTIDLDSPFSLPQALKFGVVFLVLSVVGTLGQRYLGSAGFYVVNAAGGLVSSASAVASAGQLAAHHKVTMEAGAIGAMIAALTSAAVGIPIIAKVAKDSALTRLVAVGIGSVILVGAIGAFFCPMVAKALSV